MLNEDLMLFVGPLSVFLEVAECTLSTWKISTDKKVTFDVTPLRSFLGLRVSHVVAFFTMVTTGCKPWYCIETCPS